MVIECLTKPPRVAPATSKLRSRAANLAAMVADPLADEDLHLALYLCYELHYRGHPGVDSAWEWHPGLIGFRLELESAFLAALREALEVPEAIDSTKVGELLFALEELDDGPSLSRFIEQRANLEQFREFVIHRSLYQLKESDPHSWAIPRLTGAAKTALLEVQFDEYGGGKADRMHSALFSKTMRELELDPRENSYLARIPATTIATVNLMSALGLSQSRRGMIVGHLAMFEMTSTQPNRRYANGLRRLGYGESATDFYDEHVEADAAHENIAAYDLAGGLAVQEPELACDIIFGARALLHLEGRFAGIGHQVHALAILVGQLGAILRQLRCHELQRVKVDGQVAQLGDRGDYRVAVGRLAALFIAAHPYVVGGFRHLGQHERPVVIRHDDGLLAKRSTRPEKQ